jgi:hypothetical protein
LPPTVTAPLKVVSPAVLVKSPSILTVLEKVAVEELVSVRLFKSFEDPPTAPVTEIVPLEPASRISERVPSASPFIVLEKLILFPDEPPVVRVGLEYNTTGPV